MKKLYVLYYTYPGGRIWITSETDKNKAFKCKKEYEKKGYNIEMDIK